MIVAVSYNLKLSPFYTIKFSLTNFIYQMFFDRVNYDFSTNLSKIPHLHNQNTFDTWNLSNKIWSCKRVFTLCLLYCLHKFTFEYLLFSNAVLIVSVGRGYNYRGLQSLLLPWFLYILNYILNQCLNDTLC